MISASHLPGFQISLDDLQGDMIPWTIGQQFQDPEFPLLSGARIVRIAVHPDMARAGYGSKAIQLLRRYYQGELASLDEEAEAAVPNSPQKANRQSAMPGTKGTYSSFNQGYNLNDTPDVWSAADMQDPSLRNSFHRFWRKAEKMIWASHFGYREDAVRPPAYELGLLQGICRQKPYDPE